MNRACALGKPTISPLKTPIPALPEASLQVEGIAAGLRGCISPTWANGSPEAPMGIPACPGDSTHLRACPEHPDLTGHSSGRFHPHPVQGGEGADPGKQRPLCVAALLKQSLG